MKTEADRIHSQNRSKSVQNRVQNRVQTGFSGPLRSTFENSRFRKTFKINAFLKEWTGKWTSSKLLPPPGKKK